MPNNMIARELEQAVRRVNRSTEVFLDLGDERVPLGRTEIVPSGIPGRPTLVLYMAIPESKPKPKPKPEPETETETELPHQDTDPEMEGTDEATPDDAYRKIGEGQGDGGPTPPNEEAAGDIVVDKAQEQPKQQKRRVKRQARKIRN